MCYVPSLPYSYTSNNGVSQLGKNPINSDVAKHLLMVLEKAENSAITHLELSVSSLLLAMESLELSVSSLLLKCLVENAFFVV